MSAYQEQINQLLFSGDATNMELAYSLMDSQKMDVAGLKERLQNCVNFVERVWRKPHTPLSLIQEILIDGNTLNFYFRELSDLSIDFAIFKSIIHKIILEFNGLHEIPPVIFKLSALQDLTFGKNNLAAIPDALWELPMLKILDLNGNRLTDLPAGISRLKQLEELRVYGNPMTKLPDNFASLPLLQLAYGNNSLLPLPLAIFELPRLEVLSLQGVGIRNIPSEISHSSPIKSLKMFDIGMEELPYSLRLLPQLRHIAISQTVISELPDWIEELENLEEIELQYWKTYNISENIKNLKKLKKIKLWGIYGTSLYNKHAKNAMQLKEDLNTWLPNCEVIVNF